jgi:NhaC family Na+:H+ antiporter
MAATLGVATMSYAPFAVFNLVCPLLAIAYGYFGFAQKPLENDAADGEPSAA